MNKEQSIKSLPLAQFTPCTSENPTSTLSLFKKSGLGFQLSMDKESITRRAKDGYSLILDLPKDVHSVLINRMLETTDTRYIDVLTLKRTCTYFHEMTNGLMLQFIESQHNPRAFFSNQFAILACEDSKLIPDCLVTHLHKATTLFCLASAHPDSLACSVYVKFFNIHVNTLLGHSEKADFKFEGPVRRVGFRLLIDPYPSIEDK